MADTATDCRGEHEGRFEGGKLNMRRLLNFLIAVTIVCAVFVCAVLPAGATKDVSKVGYYGGNGLWEEFYESEINQITALIRAEFNRGSKTRSEMHKGTRYFNYGESTGEYVYSHAGKPVNRHGESLGVVAGCMIQDFGGGYSTRPAAFDGRPKQWCCIMVTRASLDKGEAYTIRDSIASQYTQNGDVRGSWGLPTSNQYWVVEDGEEVLYQQFEYGYARSLKGQSYDAMFKFHHVGAENYDPDFPKTGSEDRPSYADVKIIVTEPPEVPPGPFEAPTVPSPTFENRVENVDSTYVVMDDSDLEEPVAPGETEQTASAEPDAVTETEDDLAEGTTSATVTSEQKVVRKTKNTLLSGYWGFLVAGGVVVIGALSVVLVLMKRRAHTK